MSAPEYGERSPVTDGRRDRRSGNLFFDLDSPVLLALLRSVTAAANGVRAAKRDGFEISKAEIEGAIASGLDGGGRTSYNGSFKGGEPDSTEIRFRRMRAEDHQPRQKMETNLTADTQLALAA